MNIYKSVFILVFFSLCLFSSEFDDIFGDKKTAQKKELKKIQNDDFFDDLIGAENYKKQKDVFDKLVKKAQNKAYKYYYKDAYRYLDEAYSLNFDNKKVSKIKNKIRDDQRAYLRKKREERRAKERQRQRRIAEQKQEALNQQLLMASLNNTLKKQQQINAQNQRKLNALINSSYTNKKNYSSSNSNYKKSSYTSNSSSSSSSNKYKSSSNKSSQSQKYKEQKEKRLTEEKRKKELEAQKKKRQEEIKQKKLEKQRLKQEKELKAKQEKERKEREKQEYLSKLKNGIKLIARNCYGEHHIGGLIPKYSPKPVSCIDVSYTARCVTNRTPSASGIFHNMVSNAGGCFGDTKQVKPKLGCKAQDYIVTVTNVSPCK